MTAEDIGSVLQLGKWTVNDCRRHWLFIVVQQIIVNWLEGELNAWKDFKT
jgi:hypothetical protein